jgi:hypothetical protein
MNDAADDEPIVVESRKPQHYQQKTANQCINIKTEKYSQPTEKILKNLYISTRSLGLGDARETA